MKAISGALVSLTDVWYSKTAMPPSDLIVGFILATPGGPRSLAQDQARFSNRLSLGRALRELQRALAAGRIDHLKTLGKLRRSLADAEWPDDSRVAC